MPGYDCDRFVNLSPTEKSELTCSICQDILKSPVVAQCCRQTFCDECINGWLKSNNTCPYDRKTLTSSCLSQPPRAMINMMGKLKIRCDFKDKGCKEILVLEDLSQHTIKCRFNKEKEIKKCKKCFCDLQSKSGHDCIKTLLEINIKAKEEIEALKQKSNTSASTSSNSGQLASYQASYSLRETSLLREIRDLKAERDNFLKTIQDLSNSTDTKTPKITTFPSNTRTDPKSPSLSTNEEVSEQEVFISARKQLWSPEIIQNEMNKELTQKVLPLIRSEVKENNSIFIVCKNIVDKLNEQFGSQWHCLANHHNCSKAYFTFESGFLIKLKFGLLSLQIYKTQFLNVQQLRQRFRSGKIKREIKILRTDMKQTMISDVKKIVFFAVECSQTLTDISTEIKKKMEAKYGTGGKWQCFIFAHFGVFGVHHTIGTFISFDLAELTITLFQTN